MGLTRQANGHISQSPDSGGVASYVQWDTRPSWVFRIRHPVGAQGRQRCHAGNFPEARPAHGEVPKPCARRGCRLRARRKCAICGCLPRARSTSGEVFPGRELYVRGIQLFPGRMLIVEYWTIIVYCNHAGLSANSQEMLSTSVNGIDLYM